MTSPSHPTSPFGLPDDEFSAPSSFEAAAAAPAAVKTSVPATALYLTEPGDTNAISVDDIHQGQIGDCFLLSSIGELALFHPSFISNMIHSNSNGTETVTLYTGANGKLPGFGTTAFKQVSETVTNTFASNGVNNQASQDVVNGQKEIWPQVLEKAVAALNGGMSAISNGGYPTIAMEELTGKAATWMAPSAVTATGLAAFAAAGDLLTFDTSTASKQPYGLVADHCYMFDSLTTVGGVAEVKVDNPWGPSYDPSMIPVSQLSKAFVELDIGKVS